MSSLFNYRKRSFPNYLVDSKVRIQIKYWVFVRTFQFVYDITELFPRSILVGYLFNYFFFELITFYGWTIEIWLGDHGNIWSFYLFFQSLDSLHFSIGPVLTLLVTYFVSYFISFGINLFILRYEIILVCAHYRRLCYRIRQLHLANRKLFILAVYRYVWSLFSFL